MLHNLDDKLSGRDIEVNTLEGAIKAAELLLADNPKRLAHSKGVLSNMQKVIRYVDLTEFKKQLALQAAILHDIGYGKDIALTKYHPLDGYVYLKSNGWNHYTCLTVLLHSFALTAVSTYRSGLKSIYDEILQDDMTVDLLLLIDLVSFCDLRTSTDGRLVTLEERYRGFIKSHGEDSVIYKHMLSLKGQAVALDMIYSNYL